MRKINIIIIFAIVFLATSIAFTQGGLYSICGPKGKYLNVKEEWGLLGKIISNRIKDITIIEFNGGWKDEQEAKEQLMKKLRDKKIKVCSFLFFSGTWICL